MVYSNYKRIRILYYYFRGHNPSAISKNLRDEKLSASKRRIAKFLKKYRETGSIARRSGSGRPSKVTAAVKLLVKEQMRKDDETTAHQLHALLRSKGFTLSLCTVLRCRTSLGWTFRGSAYCQLIRQENKQKRLAWARANVDLDWENVVWTDECTVQLETHRRFCCRKRGERPKNKPRYTVCVIKICTVRGSMASFTVITVIVYAEQSIP